MAAKSNSEKQRELRERRKAAGFRQVLLWVHDDDREDVSEFARKKRRERFGKIGGGDK